MIRLQEDALAFKIADITMEVFNMSGALIENSVRKDGLNFLHIFQPFKRYVLVAYIRTKAVVLTGNCSPNEIVDYVKYDTNRIWIEDNEYNIKMIDLKRLYDSCTNGKRLR